MIGMAPEQMQQLAATLTTTIPQEIESIVTKVTAQLHGTQWIGTDRTQFESEWTGTYTPQLNNVRQALITFGQLATKEAQQQVDASAS